MKKKLLWTAEGQYVGPQPKSGAFAVQTPFLAFSFERQRVQYPERGEPGITYFLARLPDGARVEVLLHRDADGIVDGILQHYPQDLPPYQQRGSVNVLVDPKRFRQGIATALLKVGGPRFKIDLTRQEFTPDGAALANRLRLPAAGK